ncbi:hypothetical protein ACHWQZ_G013200 [Mnemiopsis leidyi]
MVNDTNFGAVPYQVNLTDFTPDFRPDFTPDFKTDFTPDFTPDLTPDFTLKMTPSTTHPLPPSVNTITNSIFGVIYVVCTVFGTPGNILAVLYFRSGRMQQGSQSTRRKMSVNKAYFDQLFQVICITDAIICLSVVPNAVSFFDNRSRAWFDNDIFCSGWGLLWEILPYFSVFLVGVMSISRLVVLISPLLTLNSTAMFCCVSGYAVYLTLRSIVPVSLSMAEYVFDRTDVFCFELPVKSSSQSASQLGYWRFNTISRLLQLAFPIFPIILSSVAIVSTLFLLSRKQARRNKTTTPGSSATVTVLIFTLVYILCNLPGTANYLLMVLALKGGCSEECYHTVYAGYNILIWYSWNFTYVLCVAVNSAVNPAIYCLRMSEFREYLSERVVLRVRNYYLEVTAEGTQQGHRCSIVDQKRYGVITDSTECVDV